MEIKYVNWGIANRYPNHITINRNLKDYPQLLEPILRHENLHTDETFTLHDFKLDFISNSNVNQWEMLKFMFKHPKSLTQLLPIIYVKGEGFKYDINMIIMYSIFASIFISVLYFGGKYL